VKLDPILTKATRLARRGRYGDAIHLLEPEVVRYHDSFRYYYLLAVSCLYSGDFGGAHTYFRRARELKIRDSDALIGLAALHLRRGETDRAVDLYLEVLERDEDHRIAKKALGIVRKHGDPEALTLWMEAGRLPRVYPGIPRLASSAVAIWSTGIVVAAAAVVLILLLDRLSIIHLPFTPQPKRSGVEYLDNNERSNPVQTGGSFRYVFTRDQVLDIYEKARALFVDYRDEAAKVELNRLLESNASDAVKNKARLLLSYAAVPGFDSLKDRFEYNEVHKDPVLYRDVHVIWRGMAANLTAGEAETGFDLLVGYDTRNALQGIVPVRCGFAATVDVERPIEVLGRVVPSNGTGQGAIFRLEGLAIHQAVKKEGDRP